MAFLTPADLEKLNKNVADTVMKKFSAATVDHATLFLSHSRRDEQYLEGVKKFFSQFEATVYVDIGDDRLPANPSPQTAEILKDTVRKCPRFVVLVSANSKDSKWVPWEMGLADGYKGFARVALLPITITGAEETWAKQEYLGLYPRIYWGTVKGSATPSWLVLNPNNGTAWTLQYWLHASSL